MNWTDYFGFGLAVGFGVWWAVFPVSVIRFYTWFHKGRVRMPGEFGIRLTGTFWVLLVVAIMLFTLLKH